MANLVAPLQANPELPVFFNVDGVVGAAPAANNREDVMLVQFILKSIGEKPQDQMTPDEKAVFQAVNVTGVCDAATINAIKLVQRKKHSVNPGIVVDGRVSPARGGSYSYGGGVWTIAIINDLMQDKNTDVWPRIDLMPGCPPEVRSMVKRACVGV
jgi:hypothetical protein